MRWVLLIPLLLLAGCLNPTSLEPPTMSGSWSGTADGVVVTFASTEIRQTVSGDGHASMGTESIPLTVAGTHVYPNVILTVGIQGVGSVSFAGEFVSDDQVNGSLNGSGFEDAPFVLTRQ